MTDTDLAIDLRHVAKTYRGKVHALRDVAMTVRRGEVFGLLGPNGAGKSTLVKIMLTVVRPTRAEGSVLGRPVGDRATLARVGYLPEHHRMPRYLTGRQMVEYSGALSRVPRRARKKRAAELLETVGMTDWADRRLGTYSKGMQQRTGLAQALVADPDLVVLDEPTDGVDPVGRRDIRDVLARLRREGKTVFLNSHLLSELEMVCDRVAILVQGEVARQGTLAELTADNARYEIEVAGPAPAWIEAEAHLRAAPIGDGTRITMPGAGVEQVQPVIDRLRGDGTAIRSVRPVRESLEDLFLRAVADPETGRSLPPGASRKKEPRR